MNHTPAQGTGKGTPRTDEVIAAWAKMPAIDRFRKLKEHARSLESEVTALTAALSSHAELRQQFDAAVRIIKDNYVEWSRAGGVEECPHGYSKGIPCRKCDLETLAAALRP